MTATLVAVLSLVVLGIPITLAIDRRARGGLLIGTAFLYGSGLIFMVMLILSIIGIRWSILSVTVAALLVWLPMWFVRAPATSERRPTTFHWLDALSVITLLGFTLFATIAPVSEWDFWAIWGLKARVFFEHGGSIDWHFLESPWNAFAHPDYPVLLPFNYDFAAVLAGTWSDRWLGFLIAAYAIAVVLIVRDLAAQETAPLYAALVGSVATTLAASRFVGLADGPLVAFGAAAVLFFRRALLFDDAGAWRHAAILLGLAANVKNEGLALAVAVAIAFGILRPKALARLWPAAVIAAPWLVLRAAHSLPTDIVGGSVLSRVIARLPHIFAMFGFLLIRLAEPWFWIAVVAGILVAPSFSRRREAFVVLVSVLLVLFYVGSYLATPHNPAWHIITSWSRLTSHIALPITYAVLMMLADSFPGGRESSPHAEARPIDG